MKRNTGFLLLTLAVAMVIKAYSVFGVEKYFGFVIAFGMAVIAFYLVKGGSKE